MPRVDGQVSMYVCGPTPYDVPHLGHGRKEVVFDTIRRYLMWRGFDVTYVSNVTDIEDKIIARAHEENSTEPEIVRELRGRVPRAVRPPERPASRRGAARDRVDRRDDRTHRQARRARARVRRRRARRLLPGRQLPEYGALSHRTVEELLESAGARVDVDERKRAPIDFALWKAAKPGEPSWDSPWGQRPARAGTSSARRCR